MTHEKTESAEGFAKNLDAILSSEIVLFVKFRF